MSKDISGRGTNALEKLYKVGIGYAMIMSIVALAVGVFYREYTKYTLSGFSLDKQILVSYYLSLCHGHFILLGMVIPVILMASTYILLGGKSDSILFKALIVYLIGATGASALLLYKGAAIIYYYISNPALGLTGADQLLFMGSKALRESLYGVFHLLLGVGLVVYATRVVHLLIRGRKSM